MTLSQISKALALTAVLAFQGSLMAEQTAAEKVEAGANKAVDKTAETYREVKDEVCEMVNGKMQCVGKKVTNKAKTVSDKAKSKVQETKDKID